MHAEFFLVQTVIFHDDCPDLRVVQHVDSVLYDKRFERSAANRVFDLTIFRDQNAGPFGLGDRALPTDQASDGKRFSRFDPFSNAFVKFCSVHDLNFE